MPDFVTTLSGHKRRIPSAMATQHPDNARKPVWSPREDGNISLEMEGEEAYRNFSALGIDETMWDNEGKHVDYSIGLKLVETYTEYFREHQIGQEHYITYRIPNRWKQRGGIYRHSLIAMAAENETLRSYGFHSPAFFEAILPFTQNPYQLLGAQYDYVSNTGVDRFPRNLELIPLVEGTAKLSDIGKILTAYVEGMDVIWDARPYYVRPFIARSDPALDAGFVAADLFVLGGSSECYRFSHEHQVPVFPILGAGSASFRGGLTPRSVRRIAAKYPGFRTVTVQSAFRYDYPEAEVRQAVADLGDLLPGSEPRIVSPEERARLAELIEIFSTPYKATVTRREEGRMPIADTVTGIAERFIPSHRERAGHVGHFGYSRDLGVENVELPRAIKFVAALMTLGVPPEIIGLREGLQEARSRGLLGTLEAALPALKEDLGGALHYLNLEVLQRLAGKSEAWAGVLADVRAAETFVGVTSGPHSAEESAHAQLVSEFFEHYAQDPSGGKHAGAMRIAALKAAEARNYLG